MNSINSKRTSELITSALLANSRPFHTDFHVLNSSGTHPLLFIVNGSKLINLPPALKEDIALARKTNNPDLLRLLIAPYLINDSQVIDEVPISNPKTYALSLAIAQKCNLGCNYCYAAQGEFGTAAQSMSVETALQSIDFLVADKIPGETIQISFMGGEPLMNRKGIHIATKYALDKAKEKEVTVKFAITTNGTLIRPEDVDFFEAHSFAVTISLDGNQTEHDAQRPMKNGKGSYDTILTKIKPLLTQQRKMQVSARITITPNNINISDTIKSYIEMGFHSVGLSPLLNANDDQNELNDAELQQLLSEMINCGLEYEKAILSNTLFPFLNMSNAYNEISKQTQKPYPCGAGAGYLGVSASGELSACHRFVNDENGAMGDIISGINPDLQNKWLANRHVLQQEPCKTCWARFLCGGGCHHEVIDSGRKACDFIRTWLSYCLQSYARMQQLMN